MNINIFRHLKLLALAIPASNELKFKNDQAE